MLVVWYYSLGVSKVCIVCRLCVKFVLICSYVHTGISTCISGYEPPGKPNPELTYFNHYWSHTNMCSLEK